MGKTKYVLESMVLCNSIMSHRRGKEVIVHKYNKKESRSTNTPFSLHRKCENFDSIEIFAQCKNKSCVDINWT
jgi:hypothetical protein